MMHVQLLLIFLIFSKGKAEDDCPASDKSQLAPVRLRRHLLCNYDKNTIPLRDGLGTVTLTVQMILKYYEYDMHESSFTVHSWMKLNWDDVHLTWNPDEYDSLSQTVFSSAEIWTPDISIYNKRIQGEDPAMLDAAKFLVDNKGSVAGAPSTSYTTLCSSDLSKYPFDTHNCTLRFGSWIYNGKTLDIRIPRDAIRRATLVPNREWRLLDSYGVRRTEAVNPVIDFKFKIQRRAGAHTASVVLPIIVLIIITLISLWCAPDNPNRLNLCYINLISEFLNVQYVTWMVPLNGDKIPLILLFSRDSLLLSTFTVIFSLFLKNMVQLEKPPPRWISKILGILLVNRTQIKFFENLSFKGFSNEQNENDVTTNDSKSQKHEWLFLAKILDVLLIVIYLIVYICMFVAFIP